MDRRSFLKALGGGLLLAATSPISSAYANEKTILLTSDLASDLASTFANAMHPDLSLVPGNPIRLLDEDGESIGYCVPLLSAGIKCGYVTFDVNYSHLISDFSFESSKCIAFSEIETTDVLGENIIDEQLLVRINPLEYGIPLKTGKLLVNGDRTVACPEKLQGALRARTTWNDVSITLDKAYSDYTVSAENALGDFRYPPTNSRIYSNVKRYACSVVALFAAGLNMPNASNSGFLISDANSWDDYNRLWELTNTRVLEHYSDGRIDGVTDNYQCGPGFEKFAIEKGKRVSCSYNSTTSYWTLAGHIDASRWVIVHMGINNGSEVGHSMAAFGYATLVRKTSGSNLLYCLHVWDGWNAERYLIVEPSQFTYISNTVISF